MGRSIRLRSAAIALVVVLGVLTVGPGVANASTLSGAYEIASWSPRANMGRRGSTTVVLHTFDQSEGTIGPDITFVVSNRSTAFFAYGKWSGSPGRHRAARVSRDAFFKYCRGGAVITGTWRWSRDAHHHRYRAISAISGDIYTG